MKAHRIGLVLFVVPICCIAAKFERDVGPWSNIQADTLMIGGGQIELLIDPDPLGDS